MNLIMFFAHATIILLGVVLLASFWTVIAHVFSIKREQRISLIRTQLHQNLEAYLNALIPEKVITDALAQNTPLVLGLFAQSLVGRSAKDRLKLIALLNAEPLAKIARQIRQDVSSLRWHKRQRAATYCPYCLSPEDATELLLKALSDCNPGVSISAARALAKIGDSNIISLILQRMTQLEGLPDQRIVEILCEFCQPIVNELLKILQASENNERTTRIVIETLGKCASNIDCTVIVPYLESTNLALKLASIKALVSFKARQQVPDLIRLLDAESWEVRSVCAKALGDIGDPRAAQALTRGLGDPVWWVRLNSSRALAALGTTGLRLLEAQLGSSDPFIQDISRAALGDIRFSHLLKRT